jgi:transcriptional regulator with XRE-family HTH domain
MHTPPPHRPAFPNQLRKYRRARGLSQRAVARVLGFSDASSLSRWERGFCTPSIMTLFRLAALYRVLVDALYIDTLRTVREEICGHEAALFDHDPAKLS